MVANCWSMGIVSFLKMEEGFVTTDQKKRKDVDGVVISVFL